MKLVKVMKPYIAFAIVCLMCLGAVGILIAVITAEPATMAFLAGLGVVMAVCFWAIVTVTEYECDE